MASLNRGEKSQVWQQTSAICLRVAAPGSRMSRTSTEREKKVMRLSRRWLVLVVLGVMGALLSVATVQGQSDDGRNRRVVVVNNTSKTVDRVFASNVDSTSWEEDMLGNGVIRPGRSRIFNIDDGTGHCHYDFKVVFHDGDKIVRRNVNVCRVETWTLSDD